MYIFIKHWKKEEFFHGHKTKSKVFGHTHKKDSLKNIRIYVEEDLGIFI